MSALETASDSYNAKASLRREMPKIDEIDQNK
jgi:hypothetical protein